jgi:hypothetical protein
MGSLLADQPECWPALLLDSWKDTYATLHLWAQIVGKVRLKLTPLTNHWWNVPLYVTTRGLTTIFGGISLYSRPATGCWRRWRLRLGQWQIFILSS